MLSLIYGRCGSGKTHEIYRRIEQRAREGERSLLLIPEQFTSSVELAVLRRFGERLCHYITVADFGRIARLCVQSYGGALPTVGEALRVALCRAAMNTLKGQLKYYTADSYSPGFYALLADIVKELKMSCTPKQLIEVANSDKLRDIALVYSVYDQLLIDRREPQDALLAAADTIEEHSDFLSDTNIFIDGFDGFTAPEYSILNSLLMHDRAMCAAFCMPSQWVEEQSFFETVHKAAGRLIRLANKNDAAVDTPYILTENFRTGDDLECMNLLLSGEVVDLPEKFSDVTLTPFDSIADEVLSVAAAIHAEVRDGARYRDIALVMHSVEDYFGEVARCFDLFDIPVYFDSPNDLRFCAPARLVYSLLSLRISLSTEDILALLDTDLCDLSRQEVACLQDWVLRFYPTAAILREGVEMTAQDVDKRWFGGEKVRERLMEMLTPIFDKNKDSAGAIYETMQNLGVAKRIKDDEQIRQYNLIVGLLDELHVLTENFDTDIKELRHLYTILLQNTEFHSIPRVVDSVCIYRPDRIVNDGIKTLYMLGVNNTVFPSEVGASGLLNHADREMLAGQDMLLPGLYLNRVMLEDLYFYRTACTPSERLHISYLIKNGAKLSTALLPIAKIASSRVTSPLDEVATIGAAGVIMSRSLHTNTKKADFLKQALNDAGQESLGGVISSAGDIPCFNLNEQRNIELLLSNLSLSAGRISGYRNCGFSFLMQHLMKIEPVRRLELSADIAGTFIHTIMERILSEHSELTSVAAPRLAELCERHSAEIIKGLFGEELSPKDRFIVKRLAASALQLILFLKREQEVSDFRPVRFETELKREIDTPCGLKLTLRGLVDRMDGCEMDGERYIRVVDYKTGSKDFSLKDVLDGVDIQLFLYLFYAGQETETPAGAFYLKNRPSQIGGRPFYSYDGAVLSEGKVVEAMGGEFINIRQKADGSFLSVQENRLFDRAKGARIKRHIDKLINDIAGDMQGGSFDAIPYVKKNGKKDCEYCGYRTVCRQCDGDGREKFGSDEARPFAQED